MSSENVFLKEKALRVNRGDFAGFPCSGGSSLTASGLVPLALWLGYLLVPGLSPLP